MTGTQSGRSELLWEIANELFAADAAIEEGTMMGTRCLRLNGDFLAMPAREGGLLVKLPAARVDELAGTGVGKRFSPNGRTFKEWLHLPDEDRTVWRALLAEAYRFVGATR